MSATESISQLGGGSVYYKKHLSSEIFFVWELEEICQILTNFLNVRYVSIKTLKIIIGSCIFKTFLYGFDENYNLFFDIYVYIGKLIKIYY